MELKDIQSALTKRSSLLYSLLYILSVAYFCIQIVGYYSSEFGFTGTANFGLDYHESKTSNMKAVPHYIDAGSQGFDGQFYAQMALSPTMQDPELREALDNFNFRARRPLFSWTAYGLGLGKPSWIVQAYCIQNILFWLLLAVLLLHWFPPNHWQNAIRYLGTLFSAGIVSSINYALLDGPSLFLIALGIYLIEKNRKWIATGILALAGLGKETNLLAGAAFIPNKSETDSAASIAGKWILLLLPFAIWFSYISFYLSEVSSSDLGNGVIGLPLVSGFGALLDTLKQGGETGFPAWIFGQMLIIIALFVQCIYFLVRSKANSAWWRVGVAYSVLILCAGESVWEGHPGAITRVALPATLAFNVLFSRKAWALPVLLLVNASALLGLANLKADQAGDTLVIDRTTQQLPIQGTGKFMTSSMEGWYPVEGEGSTRWNWCESKGTITIFNPRNYPLYSKFHFDIEVKGDRTIAVNIEDVSLLASGPLNPGRLYSFVVPISLKPGLNEIIFSSEQPPFATENDARGLSFALHSYSLQILGVAFD